MNKCQYCNKETKNAKFCSRRCSGLAAPRPSRQEKVRGECEYCKKEFIVVNSGQRFCSRSCAATVNNKLFPKRLSEKNGSGICGYCSKDFRGQPGWRTSKCCSRECSGMLMKQRMIDEWSAGVAGTTKTGLSKSIRLFLIEQAGGKCSKCGWAEVNKSTGSVPLQIDHIDGNAFNNNPNNLVVLCPNCHSLTATFGGLNRGKSTRNYRYNRPEAP